MASWRAHEPLAPFLQRGLLLALWGCAVALGVFASADHGVGWDHHLHRYYGHQTLEYVASAVQDGGVSGSLLDGPAPSYIGREYAEGFAPPGATYAATHGPLPEVVLAGVERLSGLEDVRQLMRLRYVLSYLLFCAGLVVFYAVARREVGSRLLAGLGASILFLTPRVLGHSFINSYDVTFMVLYLASAWTLLAAVDRPTWRSAGLHGLVTAGLVACRTVGLIVPTVTGLLMLLLWARAPAGRRNARLLAPSLVYVLVFAVATLVLQPFYWYDFTGTLAEFQARGLIVPYAGPVLFLGETLPAAPWYYTLVWIAITVPIVYLLWITGGILITMWRCAARPGTSKAALHDLALLCLLFVPLALPIVTGARLFDSWRHHLFVYPIMLVFAVKAMAAVPRSGGRLRRAFASLAVTATALQMAWTGLQMLRLHPYQIVYFNELAGPTGSIPSRFDVDYWGVSFRAGLEYVLERHPSGTVRIWHRHYPGPNAASLLPPSERDRLSFERVRENSKANGAPTYLLVTNRWSSREPKAERVHTIEAKGLELLRIYRIAPGAGSKFEAGGSGP